MIRWGVVSTAKIAREHLLPAFHKAENAIVTGISSRDGVKARAIADRFSIPHAFDSTEALLASDQIDAVYIPLPNNDHTPVAIQAARAGKHVLCEKPMGMNTAEIESVIAAQRDTGVLITESFMVHYHPQWQKVRDLVQNGAIGELLHVQGAFSFFNADPQNTRNQLALGGGALPDIGVYPSVTTRFVTGQEPHAMAARIRYDAQFKTDVFSSVRADFGNFELSFYVSTQASLYQRMAFHGTKGIIELLAPFNPQVMGTAEVVLTRDGMESRETFRYGGVDHYHLLVEAVSKAIQSGDHSTIMTLESSLNNQRMIDAIYRAGQEPNGAFVAV